MRKKLIATAALVALSAGAALAAGMVAVDQKGMAFNTGALAIDKGTIVSFNNSDTTSHNILVTGNGVNLNSGLQAPGVAFKAPFLKPGVYGVMCGIHPKMKMTVTVK
jgi:plastocyanin